VLDVDDASLVHELQPDLARGFIASDVAFREKGIEVEPIASNQLGG
jgi:hypothetical protein